LNDGAAALLVASEDGLKRLGATPLARVVATAVAGVEPRVMGMGPVPSTRKVLAQAKLDLGMMDVIELNEAFAAQSLACFRELGLRDDDPRVNPNGGANRPWPSLGDVGCAAVADGGARARTTGRALRAVHDVYRSGAGHGDDHREAVILSERSERGIYCALLLTGHQQGTIDPSSLRSSG
jgi:acetyl-CoA acetyltransferase